MDERYQEEVVRLLPARSGHFRLESGRHGNLWLDLPRLCLDPTPVATLTEGLAARLSAYAVDAVCGPLVEGAFVGLMVASRLKVAFTYTEPRQDLSNRALFPVRYLLPQGLRSEVKGRRVAVVNDVINAGSAVRGTLAELRACGASPVVIGTLAVLGRAAGQLAAEADVGLETLASLPNEIWEPSACPMCAARLPLTDRLA